MARLTRTPKRVPPKIDMAASAQNQIESILNSHGPFMSLAEASRRFKAPLPTLADAVRAGRLSALRLFGKSYVRVADVEAYLTRDKRQGSKSRFQEELDRIVAIGDDSDLPTDFSVNLDHYLYGHDKVKAK